FSRRGYWTIESSQSQQRLMWDVATGIVHATLASHAPCYFLHTDIETRPPPRSQSTPRNIYAFGLTSFLNDTASEMAYWVLPAFLASIGAGAAQLGIIE